MRESDRLRQLAASRMEPVELEYAQLAVFLWSVSERATRAMSDSRGSNTKQSLFSLRRLAVLN